MKKVIPRKLVVRRETLRALERVELVLAVGGVNTRDFECPALPVIVTGVAAYKAPGG